MFFIFKRLSFIAVLLASGSVFASFAHDKNVRKYGGFVLPHHVDHDNAEIVSRDDFRNVSHLVHFVKEGIDYTSPGYHKELHTEYSPHQKIKVIQDAEGSVHVFFIQLSDKQYLEGLYESIYEDILSNRVAHVRLIVEDLKKKSGKDRFSDEQLKSLLRLAQENKRVEIMRLLLELQESEQIAAVGDVHAIEVKLHDFRNKALVMTEPAELVTHLSNVRNTIARSSMTEYRKQYWNKIFEVVESKWAQKFGREYFKVKADFNRIAEVRAWLTKFNNYERALNQKLQGYDPSNPVYRKIQDIRNQYLRIVQPLRFFRDHKKYNAEKYDLYSQLKGVPNQYYPQVNTLISSLEAERVEAINNWLDKFALFELRINSWLSGKHSLESAYTLWMKYLHKVNQLRMMSYDKKALSTSYALYREVAKQLPTIEKEIYEAVFGAKV